MSAVSDIGFGRFLTFEGGEGAGKTTQARLLAEAIAARGIPVLRTREPGGAPGSEVLRDLLLNGGVDWSAPAEAMLHFAARAEHVERTIRPALASATWVICDRFTDSTMAYQGYGQGADRRLISMLTQLIGLRPDLTIILDVPPDIAASRLAGRGTASDRYDRLGVEFHTRVAEGFRRIAQAEPDRCLLMDASGTEQAVHASVMRIVDARLG